MNGRSCVTLLLVILAAALSRASIARADTDQAAYLDQAALLLSDMTGAERVGQLFLVSFEGSSIEPDSPVVDLVLNYHIGGVALQRENDNFAAAPETIEALRVLTTDLQRLAIEGLPPAVTSEGSGDEAVFVQPGGAPGAVIPLFISTSHEGGGPPGTEILSGLTPVPSQMAIGATWEPSFSFDAGRVLGTELASLGINMLLGPSLDVVERPLPATQADLGTRVFGGDPYWVGQLGQAFVGGVHAGSNSRVAVIASHFPGNGSSDRPIDEEVSTVRKSLEQLKQIELAPFVAVTGNLLDQNAVADGLLTTHIRFQGFQGNIRATTAPISFDYQALSTLMSLAPFDVWRRDGGLLVSDRLGVRAVERFYDDTGETFPHRRIAKDALLAGNDLLYLAQFALDNAGAAEELANIQDTIAWFQERYLTDIPFQQRVDQAATRILATKLSLYGGDFSLSNVVPEPIALPLQDDALQASLVDLAQRSITLVSPSQDELAARNAGGPTGEDGIVVFTDVRPIRQCSDCPLQPSLNRSALADRMLSLYGPSGSGQVRADQIDSFSYEELQAFLDAGPGPVAPPIAPTLESTLEPGTPAPTPEPSPAYEVQEALRTATWILFAALDVGEDVPASGALNEFLALRSDLTRERSIVVFAFDAPYYLDTTEISKLTAYYGVYSRTTASIDAALQALFQDSPATGRSPVNVEAVGYDLFSVTQPDPGQVIELFIFSGGSAQSPASEQPLEYVVGDTLRLQTGIITDLNGNPVPDGTLVQFTQLDRINGFVNVLAERPTAGGSATLDYVLEARTGQFRITASAGVARASEEVDIAIGDNVRIVVITPTPAPTALPTATLSPTATVPPTPTSSPTPDPTLGAPGGPVEPALQIPLADLSMLLSMLAGIAFLAGASYAFGTAFGLAPASAVRLGLWSIIGGLLAYLYIVLGLPGSTPILSLGSWGALLSILGGGALGLAMCWWRLSSSVRPH